MSEKVTGYSLISIGILIILFAFFSVYRVFTKQAEVVQLFSFPGISIDSRQLMPKNLPSEAAQLIAQSPSEKIELVSAEILNGPINLYAYLFFMGFVATIGYKIASLGVMLVRPIVVKLNTRETSSPPPPTTAQS